MEKQFFKQILYHNMLKSFYWFILSVPKKCKGGSCIKVWSEFMLCFQVFFKGLSSLNGALSSVIIWSVKHFHPSSHSQTTQLFRQYQVLTFSHFSPNSKSFDNLELYNGRCVRAKFPKSSFKCTPVSMANASAKTKINS